MQNQAAYWRVSSWELETDARGVCSVRGGHARNVSTARLDEAAMLNNSDEVVGGCI